MNTQHTAKPRTIYWNVQVWLCRRFLRTMTVEKAGVLAHVTGLSVTTVLAMHPSCHEKAAA